MIPEETSAHPKLREALAAGVVRQVDRLPTGHIRLETGLSYPDGSSVDIFVLGGEFANTIVLSDLGQTTGWLLDMQVRPWLSKKRQSFVDDILRLHAVRQDGGALTALVPDSENPAIGILRLAQACVRFADLTFTRRASLLVPFADDIAELIGDSDLVCEPDVQFLGRSGAPVRVDYVVTGKTRRSAVLGLSATNSTTARNMVNDFFRRWYELDTSLHTYQRVTLYDDRKIAYRDEDLTVLSNVSHVLPFTEKEMVLELLSQ